jgi:hypothetical protein
MISRKATSCLVAALLVAVAAEASAQFGALENTTPEERAGIQTELMKAKLGLQPEQLSQVGALNLEYARKMEPVIHGSDGPFAKMRAAREIESQKEADLKKILSGDQFTLFLAGKEEMRQKFEQRMAEKTPGGG